MEGICCEAAKRKFQLIFNSILVGSKRQLLSDLGGSYRILANPIGSWQILSDGGRSRILADPIGFWRILTDLGEAYRILAHPIDPGGFYWILTDPKQLLFDFQMDFN